MPAPFANNPGVTWTEHVEAVGPLEIDYAEDETRARRTLDVDWGNYDAAAQALLGYAQVQTTAAGTKFLGRVPPDACDVVQPIPGGGAVGGGAVKPYLFARAVKVRGMAPTGSSAMYSTPSIVQFGGTPLSNFFAGYKKARLLVEYGTPEWDILSDQEMIAGGFTRKAGVGPPGSGIAPGVVDPACPDESSLARNVVRRPVPAGTYVSVQANFFKYVLASPQLIPQGIGRMVVNVNVMLVWKNVPAVAIPCGLINPNVVIGAGAVEQCLGTVNSVQFAGAPWGTMLFMAAEFRSLKNRFGVRTYDVAYGWKWQNPGVERVTNALVDTVIGHNHILRPDITAATFKWTQVSMPGTDNVAVQAAGKSPYDWADHRSLFWPP